MEATELAANLSYFTGSDTIYSWSVLYQRFFLTEGAKYLADQAGAYWLMDIIGSYQPKLIKRGEVFQVWKLTVKNGKGLVVCEDGNDKALLRQRIPYTDFPLAEVKLYAGWDGERLVILLPSEF